jgi:cleavage and polyadenylation specificity factor subunit 1
MPYLETITSLKVMPLEVSEHTHAIKPRIVVGTVSQRGEDAPAKGAVNVFEILDVVPEPDRPESGVKLNLISREETRGAVTAVEAFPGGLIGTAQGQKLMIRGLKEDGSCLPVAFLDCQCYTLSLKHLSASGLWLAADAWKGVWFGGFTQEPYKLTTLGKSRTKMEVVAAEFLPFDGQLFLMVVDANMDLAVLQYDPENPKTLSGTRLLRRSTFHLGQFASQMLLLPSGLAPVGAQPVHNGINGNEGEAAMQTHAPTLYHVLTTSLTGSIGLITPVDEATYRRMGSLQTHLTNVLEHAAGLNPRAYRAVESEGFGSRGVVDGSLVRRISELGAARRAEVLARAGSDRWALRSDLSVVGGGGLGYL